MYKELTYDEALEFYNRWGRTILIGSSLDNFYSFNKIEDKKSLDDCIKQYLNYYDGPVHFFLSHGTLERDKELQTKNESKNMNKKLIRLTESDLHRVINESVKRILRESADDSTNPEYYKVLQDGNAQNMFAQIQQALRQLDYATDNLCDMGYNDPSTPNGLYISNLRKMVKDYLR